MYLDGARSVTEGYAKTHKKGASEELEANFRNVLVTIEDVFAEQQAKLLQNNELDLDVQIEVLGQGNVLPFGRGKIAFATPGEPHTARVFDQGAAPIFFGDMWAGSETTTGILKFPWDFCFGLDLLEF